MFFCLHLILSLSVFFLGLLFISFTFSFVKEDLQLESFELSIYWALKTLIFSLHQILSIGRACDWFCMPQSNVQERRNKKKNKKKRTKKDAVPTTLFTFAFCLSYFPKILNHLYQLCKRFHQTLEKKKRGEMTRLILKENGCKLLSILIRSLRFLKNKGLISWVHFCPLTAIAGRGI